MQLSTERQEEIKHLIATATFRDLTDPTTIKLFCIDTLIMCYNELLSEDDKATFACNCPFCEFFNDAGEFAENFECECLNCPWTEQTAYRSSSKNAPCNFWFAEQNLTSDSSWCNLPEIRQPRLTMLWEWREIYSQQLTP